MVRGAIILPVSIVALPPAVPADTAPRTTVRILILPVHGVSIVIHSTNVQKPARPAVHLPTTMLTTAIPMARGFRTTKRSISAPRRALPAETPAMNMLTIPTRTATANATIAAQRLV